MNNALCKFNKIIEIKNMSLIIKFYNVEHGSCTHIITPNNKHILIDVGSKSDSSIVQYLKNNYFFNAGRIDGLIITHTHEDHIYGIPDLYKYGIEPRVLNRPKDAYDIVPQNDTTIHKDIAEKANKMNRDYSSPVPNGENPFLSSNNGGVEIEIIEPPSLQTTKEDLNTFSSFVIVKYNGYKFVLSGDNSRSIVQNMYDNNTDGINSKVKDATVYLAPHHGREAEFCADFFKQVNPIISIISDKKIVHDSQLDSSKFYAGRGIKLRNETRHVLTTRNDGNITFEVSQGCNVSIDNDY